ncbi:MAG: PQQ-dependent sugar dehydrogenase [Hyphomicrobiaceae bacterium]
MHKALMGGAILLATTLPALAVQTKAPAAPPTAIAVQSIAKGLNHPWGLQFLPDGRMVVSERAGPIRIVGRDGTISPPIAGVPAADVRGQGGMLDVALAPDFATSGLLFFSFSEPRGGSRNGTSVGRGRLVLDGNRGRLENVKVIFQQDPPFASTMHFGSRLVFDRGGNLFVTTGDRYSARDEAQNPANHLGKVIRINSDGEAPADNPKRQGWRQEIWSIGHRNVQGAALHPETGKLWTAEHGARGGDEVNIPEKGKNYGWPIITYGRDYSGVRIGEGTAKAGLEQPIYYWDPSPAPSGAAFYTGDLFPGWKGNLLVGALAGQALHRLVLDGEQVVAEEVLLKDRGRIRDVRQGPDGAVWLLTDDPQGEVLRVAPAGR